MSGLFVSFCYYFCVTCLLLTTATHGVISPPDPEIVIEPNIPELEVNAGDGFNLTCKGNIPVEWMYNVYEPNSGEQSSVREVTDLIQDGVHISKLQLRQAYFLDTGFFYCFPRGSSWNSPNAAKIYIYVKDEDNLLAVNNTFVIMTHKQYDTVEIPCRPTAPDVQVTLTKEDNPVIPDDPTSDVDVTYNRQMGYLFHSITMSDAGTYMCIGSRGDTESDITYHVYVLPRTDSVAKPYISVNPPHIVVGHEVVMDCSCRIALGVIIFLNWTVPKPELIKSGHIQIMNDTIEQEKSPNIVQSSIGHKKLVIYNVTREDEGTYYCHVIDASNNTNQASTYLKVFHQHMTFLNLSLHGNTSVFEAQAGVPSVQWIVNIDAYPAPLQVTWFDPHNKQIVSSTVKNRKYEIENDNEKSKLKIIAPDINDSGTYSLHVNNDAYTRKINVTLFVHDRPSVQIKGKSPGFYMVNENHKIECNVIAHPEPKIEWYFKDCSHYPVCDVAYTDVPRSSYSEIMLDKVFLKSTVSLPANRTGELLCSACNKLGCTNDTAPFLVTDVENGFSASAPDLVVTSDNITLHCGASLYNYSADISWYYKQGNTTPLRITWSPDKMVTFVEKPYSHNVLLNIPNVDLQHSGEYICRVKNLFRSTSSEERKVFVNVKNLTAPVLLPGSNMNVKWKSPTGKKVQWNCFVHGTPPPTIVWYKDDRIVDHLKNDSRYVLLSDNQTLVIKFLALADDGDYTCIAKNKAGYIKATGTVILTDKPALKEPYLIVALLVFVFALLFVSVLYFRKSRRSKRLKQELTAAGLLNFEKGCIESLNPDLDVVDQAEFLPYDKRWEFPREKLKLGKQLGSGAFGVVLKAEAHGLIEPDVSTVVAVKMVKRNCDITYIKALASELKIMIHLGKHLNVVNLLGACTGNLNNRELLVMVEYCRYGNLHNYLLRHRDAFINQVNPKTGMFDSTFIASSPRLKYADLSFSNGGVQPNGTSNEKSQTDETLVTSDMSVMSTPVGEDGYLISKEPEWRSNYRGDYKGTSVRPICTQDLLCWGFQVARGMEYLASRKVLHGDLAARNILLADENVVKICDFGFSKSMYKDNSYHKKGNGPLPVKWMSIEAIQDRVFSTQSDVWAYGIVLWEFFSLAQTPYPGMEADEKLFNKLIEGYRMDQPKYATNEVYKVMLECWHKKPQMRPSFTDLAEKLGNMLEDTVRTHYVDMNDPYLKSNTEFLAQQDYLSMLRSPTYSNWQPSPLDGYTSMKPGSTDAKEAMELTPMLDSTSGAVSSDIESVPNSPTYKPSTPRDPLQEQVTDHSNATSTSPPSTAASTTITTTSAQGINNLGNNYVNVAQVLGFSNPSYHNLGRPKKSPYVNMPDSADES